MWFKINLIFCLVAMISSGPISNLDQGLLHKFVSIDYVDGRTVTGEVIGVYNERVFMWHPRNRDTLALFKCNRPDQGLDSFTTDPNSDNAVFTLNSDEISTITMVPPASDATTYVEYLRSHDITLQHQTIQGDEVYILTDWSTYHTWEDGRSDYGWDLSALNSNMMTYSYYGTRLTDFAVYGLDCYLPLGGKVVSVARSNPDNTPDIITAVDFGILTTGSEANLEELPNNGVEITPGGPFLLRVIHQQRNTISASIQVGDVLQRGAHIGKAGNSGTSYTPHIHLVFGFYDQNDRYWSTPIEWVNYQRRQLLAYPSGYQYSSRISENRGYPTKDQLIKSAI